jgi:hypothetical protein
VWNARLRWRRWLASTVLGGLVSGCSASMGELSLVSSREAEWPVMALAAGVEGSDCVSSVLFVPLRGRVPSVQAAAARAIASVPEGELLTDAAVTVDAVSTVVFNRQCVRVRGTVGRLVRVIHLP